MGDYRFFNIPRSCEVKNTIFKKLFYENADLSTADQKLFTEAINKITWLYCLKPETINLQPYRDEIREYDELEIIEVEITAEKKINRLAEIIMRTIPYPMVLIFRLHNQVKFYVAHQRSNLQDSTKNTIEEFISTDWLEQDNPLFAKLDLQKMRFTNFYALYSDIVDTISIANIAGLIPSTAILSGEEARQLSSDLETLEQEIIALRAKLKKETQFNRKMELNIAIKQLEQEKRNLMGGFAKTL
ncbi:MAG: DUF4391 domain-containing protein [Desulfitobacteriaceae bacterium]|nr:DUF4391 domain-containing protein [Desulfitobacteriaceae bacterium]